MEELEVDRIENWSSLVRFDSVYIDSRVIMEIVYWLICHAFENVFIQVSNQIFLNMWNLRESPNKSSYVIPEYVLFRHIKIGSKFVLLNIALRVGCLHFTGYCK